LGVIEPADLRLAGLIGFGRSLPRLPTNNTPANKPKNRAKKDFRERSLGTGFGLQTRKKQREKSWVDC
jgi:hypothetical protein